MHVALGDFVILNLQDFYYEILWHVLSQIFPFSVFLMSSYKINKNTNNKIAQVAATRKEIQKDRQQIPFVCVAG